MDEINQKFQSKINSRIKLSYYKKTKRVEIVLGTGVESVIFSDRLSVILGFGSQKLFRPSDVPSYTILAVSPPDFNFCPTRLFIYCDILQAQVLGDVYAPLLFNLALEGEHKRVVTVNPIRSYINVGRSSFDSISINILNEFGEEVTFYNGASSVSLHFRPKGNNGGGGSI